MYNSARCCPSRAALLTGLNPHQAGIGHMTADLGAPSYQGYLNRSCATIAEVLRPHGYATMMSGKWHAGGDYRSTDPGDWDVGGPPTRRRRNAGSTAISASSAARDRTSIRPR